jgi:hypothetical protein
MRDETWTNDPDEWTSVGKQLGDQFGVLGSRSRIGRALREASILLADPDTSDEEVDVLRHLAAELDEMANELRRSGS